MSLWLGLKELIEINPYLLVLFAISISFWALFFSQLLDILSFKAGSSHGAEIDDGKAWIRFWFQQNQHSIQVYQIHKHLTVMKALVVALPLVGLAGTVMLLSNGFHTLSLAAEVDIRAFSGIVSGAMATTFTGVFLSVIGMLLFKILDVAMKQKYKEIKT